MSWNLLTTSVPFVLLWATVALYIEPPKHQPTLNTLEGSVSAARHTPVVRHHYRLTITRVCVADRCYPEAS